ncbi:type II toxin-antitoxin system VapC family toxin [Halomicrobium urmianum]|uniref:type II toxin-antitoxin system VapC family toxin n=1 Tax=Halomicrobium urmianum TaxID=1586233 RepID=UPI001CD94FD1|nr:type II toxin-antitoxin system VapC family toxin [Halomicrobium urmianum]
MRLLDTSVLARWGDPDRKGEVVPYLQDHADERFVTSSLIIFEFFRPVKRRDNRRQVQSWLGRVLDDVEPFTESASMTAAGVESRLREQDAALEMRDLLIAAHARELGATFVTCDSGDFGSRRIQQLLDVDVVA